jgi:hypothetical protein
MLFSRDSFCFIHWPMFPCFIVYHVLFVENWTFNKIDLFPFFIEGLPLHREDLCQSSHTQILGILSVFIGSKISLGLCINVPVKKVCPIVLSS